MGIREILKDLLTKDKTPIDFSRRVEAGGEGTDEYEFKQDGNVTDLKVRFYPGTELDLHLRIYIDRKGSDRRDSLIEYPAQKDYLAGDDDKFVFDVKEEVREGDEMVIAYKNLSTQYGYDFIALSSLEVE